MAQEETSVPAVRWVLAAPVVQVDSRALDQVVLAVDSQVRGALEDVSAAAVVFLAVPVPAADLVEPLQTAALHLEMRAEIAAGNSTATSR